MSAIPSFVSSFLKEDYALSKEQISFYQQNRFIKLKQVFSQEVLSWLNEVITERVRIMNKETRSLDERNTYGKAFLQLFNLWLEDEQVSELVLSRRLGKIAAELMQCEGVRLYHDQALFKEAGGGFTPWHADQYYWPLQTDKTITAWIPLQPTPLEMGPLEFSAGSHAVIEGRELEIGDDSETQIRERLKVTDFAHVIEPFDLGEMSFHSGWVFHRAGANNSQDMRKVMTIIYMDRDMRLKAPENKNQQLDWDTWCPGAQIGEVINSKINPIIYQH
jgi:ectoine hydroxylase-related dioxygenase (phytanoyl-CoA dioxygenase family)